MTNPYADYGQAISNTPQSIPIPGREQDMVLNNAGGYGFILDKWFSLERFVLLGSFGGTYYVSERKLTQENASVVVECLKENGPRAVQLAHDVNVENRAPKVDQQLFVLALALQHGDAETKKAVERCAPKMLRTGTHQLHFAAMLKSLGPIGSRTKRRILATFYCQDSADLAYQLLKYQNRDGWRQADAIRLAHPKPPTPAHSETLAWALGKLDLHEPLPDALPQVLRDYQKMLSSDGPALQRALVALDDGLPREALPTEVLQHEEVQRKLLPQLPLNALLRNLGNLSAPGLLRDEDVTRVVNKLTSPDGLRRARVHPFGVLLATLVYRSGAGLRGSKTWTPVKAIMSALEDAYELAFVGVKPTEKRILIGVDVSRSMSMPCVGTPVRASTAAAAMALTLARLEPHATAVTFDTRVQRTLMITKRTGIASLENHEGGGTDLSAPVNWALKQQREYDAFVILSDNETWYGCSHPTEALTLYRQMVNKRAKLICCSMASNSASVVDPHDPLQLGAAGLDANLPRLVADFIRA